MSWCKKIINAELVLTGGLHKATKVTLFDPTHESRRKWDWGWLIVSESLWHNLYQENDYSIFNHSNAYKFFIAVVRGFSIAKFCFKQFMNVTKLSNFCSSWNNQKHFSDDFKGNVINLANIRSTIWRQFDHFSYS